MFFIFWCNRAFCKKRCIFVTHVLTFAIYQPADQIPIKVVGTLITREDVIYNFKYINRVNLKGEGKLRFSKLYLCLFV